MATARNITFKNLDYFKFRKIIVDLNSDDYDACSKDIKQLYDSASSFSSRNVTFNENRGFENCQTIIRLYKEVLAAGRIDGATMRVKSGWWGEQKNAYQAGKVKTAILKEVLCSKSKEWYLKTGGAEEFCDNYISKIDGPGVCVLKHKVRECFQCVFPGEKCLLKMREVLGSTFDAQNEDPIAALLIVTLSDAWDFYFVPAPEDQGDEEHLKILENDTILKHNTLWPYGLNIQLHTNTPLQVAEFRRSCINHRWPPLDDDSDEEIITKPKKTVKSATSSPGPRSPMKNNNGSIDNSSRSSSKSSLVTSSSGSSIKNSPRPGTPTKRPSSGIPKRK